MGWPLVSFALKKITKHEVYVVTMVGAVASQGSADRCYLLRIKGSVFPCVEKGWMTIMSGFVK